MSQGPGGAFLVLQSDPRHPGQGQRTSSSCCARSSRRTSSREGVTTSASLQLRRARLRQLQLLLLQLALLRCFALRRTWPLSPSGRAAAARGAPDLRCGARTARRCHWPHWAGQSIPLQAAATSRTVRRHTRPHTRSTMGLARRQRRPRPLHTGVRCWRVIKTQDFMVFNIL